MQEGVKAVCGCFARFAVTKLPVSMPWPPSEGNADCWEQWIKDYHASIALMSASTRHANNGVSRYPSYQKIFQLAENFQNIYRTLSKLDKFSLNFLSI